jgi:hypothetical protein
MGMFMKVIGTMIKQKVTAFTPIKMGHSIKGNGKKTNNMAKEKKHGQMEHTMKVIISWVKNMAKGHLFGLMGLYT